MESSNIPQQETEIPATRQFRRGRLTWASYWMLGYFAYLEAVLGPLMPFLRSDLRLSYTIASLHFSAFACGAVVMGATGDRLTQRWGRRASFWAGALGMAAGAMMVALSPMAVGTIAGAFLMGLLGDLLLITIQAALADFHGLWSSVALTEANVAASGFAILAAVSVGIITGAGLGWRLAVLPALTVLALAGARFWSLRFPAATPKPSTGGAEAARSAKLPWRYWVLWSLIAVETGLEWCIVYWGASFLATWVGFPRADAATSMGLFFLAMLVGRFAGSRLSRALPGLALVMASLLIALGGFLLFWLAPLPLVRLTGLFLLGLGLANIYPLGVALAAGTAPGQADQANARLAIAGGLSALAAPAVLGALADAIGIGSAFGIVIPMLLLALLIAWAASRARD
ncbi:MAG: MFS transporter [Nitrososphaerota archaeon]